MKNEKVAFTICTYSYLGIAKALQNSFLKYNSDYDFYIVLADHPDITIDDKIIDARDVLTVDDNKYYEMAFKYNIAEFCTSIKPYMFSWLFAKNYLYGVYLDPDILFFSRLDEYSLNDDYSVYLVPHINKMHPTIENEWKQEVFLKYGVFNCGFVGIKNDEVGRMVVNWWEEKLQDKAFSDEEEGLYTDQKWIDILFCFLKLEKIKIIKKIGYDIAPWNYSERRIFLQDSEYKVTDRENNKSSDVVCFVHFSAYDYSSLAKGEKAKATNASIEYRDTDVLTEVYSRKLKESDALVYLSNPYKYGYFDDGTEISAFVRRLFRSYINKYGCVENPFSIGRGSFYQILKKKKLLTKENHINYSATDIRNYNKKNYLIEKIMKCLFKILGVNKYVMLLKKMRKLSRFENNLFLIE